MQIITNVDTFFNIHKRKVDILYRTSISPSSASVSFISNQAISSDLNMSITDRSTSLVGNRVFAANFNIIEGASFSVATEDFIVTDIFVESTNTISELPLFFQHILDEEKVPRDGENLAAGVKLLSIDILDEFLQSVRVPDKLVDFDRGILYNNLASEFNNTTDYLIYFVRYTINDNGAVKTFVDLLNNQNIYRPATFEDLDENSELITDGRKVYLIEESITGFNIQLPISGTYAFKSLDTARIKILPPPNNNILDPWFVKVTAGTFFQNVGGTVYKYYISEFLSQTFNPEIPIKRVLVEESTIINDRLIKLDNSAIYFTDELFLDIQINNLQNEGVAAFTTNPDIVGDIAANGKPFVKWTQANRLGIRSVDQTTGIVEIENLTLKETWKARAAYYYQEKNYELSLINFNPVTNREIRQQKVSLFIDPDTSLVTKDQTLYYLKLDETGKVTETNWSLFSNDDQTLLSTSDPVYYESYPDFLPSGDHHIFIDEFTVEGGTNSFNYLVLGDITVTEAQSIDNATIFDSRTRGGGIIESLVDEAIDLQPEVLFFWDIGAWDGTPYPGNASYFAEVPVGILTNTTSGLFTQTEVRDIVTRHTALGVYPITKAYGIDVTVTGIVPQASGLEVFWFSNGAI